MKKIIVLITLLFIFTFSTSKTHAAEKIADASAALQSPENASTGHVVDARVTAVQNVLERYSSPLAPYAKDYVHYADKYSVDWKLLPSIAGLESTFGKNYIPGTYNVYGWGSGRIYFDSWAHGIEVINKSLRTRYMDRGATTVWTIGPIYAESPTWAVRVNSFMAQFEREYIELTTTAVDFNL